jgi:polyphosphate kinase
VVPVTDPALQARLAEILEIELADDQLAWELGPAGGWRRAENHTGLNSQERFKALAHERSRQSGASIS